MEHWRLVECREMLVTVRSSLIPGTESANRYVGIFRSNIAWDSPIMSRVGSEEIGHALQIGSFSRQCAKCQLSSRVRVVVDTVRKQLKKWYGTFLYATIYTRCYRQRSQQRGSTIYQHMLSSQGREKVRRGSWLPGSNATR